jgi:hypothetical protein
LYAFAAPLAELAAPPADGDGVALPEQAPKMIAAAPAVARSFFPCNIDSSYERFGPVVRAFLAVPVVGAFRHEGCRGRRDRPVICPSLDLLAVVTPPREARRARG